MPPTEQNNLLGQQIRVLSTAIRQTITQKLNAQELTGTQSFVLCYLSEREGEVVYPKDIERRFRLTHPTVSGILQRLEAKGFVTLTPDPDDRRCRRVALTQKARDGQKDIGDLIAAMEQAMVQNMTPQETRQLHTLLDRALHGLKEFTQKEDSCP